MRAAVEIATPGLVAPGFESWAAARAVLAGEIPYVPGPAPACVPTLLDPRERRRAPPAVRLALVATEQAQRAANVPAAELSNVFASSLGDGTLLNSILLAISDPDRKVSPTQFHNSVHNAAAGYWTIGSGNRMPCTSIAAHDFTFAIGLLKATAQATADNAPVLLTVFDHPFPEPLDATRHLEAPFASAIVMGTQLPMKSRIGRLTVAAADGTDPTPPKTSGLDSLWKANPAARALPLLEAIASRTETSLLVARSGSQCLNLTYMPG